MQDATVQSIPQTSPTQTAVAPSSYVAPAPTQYQVGTAYPQAVPQAAPQGVTSYQSAPTQYAPQSQPDQTSSNPWESAFNKVVNLLGSPVQSPFQGQPSQPTPQFTPANYGQPSNQATQQSVPQTWSTNPTYSPNSLQTPNTNEYYSGDTRRVLPSFAFETKRYFSRIVFGVPEILPSSSITIMCISSNLPPLAATDADVPG